MSGVFRLHLLVPPDSREGLGELLLLGFCLSGGVTVSGVVGAVVRKVLRQLPVIVGEKCQVRVRRFVVPVTFRSC